MIKRVLVVYGNLYIDVIDTEKIYAQGGSIIKTSKEMIQGFLKDFNPDDVKVVYRNVRYHEFIVGDDIQFFIYVSGIIEMGSIVTARMNYMSLAPEQVEEYPAFYAVSGSVINAPIEISDPYITMGLGPYKGSWDLGYVCSQELHGKINIWSLHKPNRQVPDLFLPETANNSNGAMTIPSYAPADINYLSIIKYAIWEYTLTYDTFRLDDFIGYKHDARAPVWGLDVTPINEVHIGDTISFVYRVAGTHPNQLGFGVDVLKNKYLGVIITGEKSNGTTEDGIKFTYDYNSRFRQVKINDRYFFDGTQGVFVEYYISITLAQNEVIKPGIFISCMIALFDSKNINTARATSLMLPPPIPEDMFLTGNTFAFKVL